MLLESDIGWKALPNGRVLKSETIRNESKQTISTSGVSELLQMVLESKHCTIWREEHTFKGRGL